MLNNNEAAAVEKAHGVWPRYKWPIMGVAALLLGLAAGWVIITLIGTPYTYHGTVIQSPERDSNFTLIGPEGKPLSLYDFRGQAVLLYFGYTFCPDVCPATMVELAQATEMLGDEADKSQVIMVSVDPQRDTPEKLQSYVTHFDPSFIGVTGSEDEVAAVATQYGIYYEKHEGTVATGYLFDHTASVIVIDPDGYLRLVYPFGTPAEDIAGDLQQLID